MNVRHATLVTALAAVLAAGVWTAPAFAHFEPGMDEPFFSYPPVRETVDATLKEVNRCTREDIRINTFMLDASSYLKAFVEKITQLNGGRAFFTTPDTLGDYVLVDFIEHRRRLGHKRPA